MTRSIDMRPRSSMLGTAGARPLIDDLRAVLEGIVYAEDPKITAADRVRAIGELRELNRLSPPLDFRAEVAALSDEQVDAWLDHFGAWDAGELLDGIGEAAERMPHTSQRLRAELDLRVEVRAEAIARRLADADRIEAEVERRARELADGRYIHDGLQRLQDSLGGRDGLEPAPESPGPSGGRPAAGNAPTGGVRPLDPPPGIDLSRGWPERDGRRGLRRGHRLS
jgi:hypothetical protein